MASHPRPGTPLCNRPGCTRAAYRRNLCRTHHQADLGTHRCTDCGIGLARRTTVRCPPCRKAYNAALRAACAPEPVIPVWEAAGVAVDMRLRVAGAAALVRMALLLPSLPSGHRGYTTEGILLIAERVLDGDRLGYGSIQLLEWALESLRAWPPAAAPSEVEAA